MNEHKMGIALLENNIIELLNKLKNNHLQLRRYQDLNSELEEQKQRLKEELDD